MSLVLPGDALGSSSDYDGGVGTYERAGSLFASRVGVRRQAAGGGVAGVRPSVCVVRAGGAGAELVTVAVGALVTVRVSRVSQAAANVEVLLVDGRPLAEPAGAVIRRDNVRDGEVDKLDMLEAFRPGDLVRAAVVSLGDARSYYLSTAEAHLGVVHAASEGGAAMAPLGADTMHVPGTAVVEKRKIALGALGGAGVGPGGWGRLDERLSTLR